MAKRDYYDVLGLPRSASAEQIRAAYRRLAKKYHPDVAGKDASASERFKEVQEAYEVLSDPQKRQQYDRFGHVFEHEGAAWPGAGAGWPGAGTARAGSGAGTRGRTYTWSSGGPGVEGFDFSEFFGGFGTGGAEDIFERLRGRSAGPQGRQQRGQDVQHTINVTFEEAINGTKRELVLTIPQADGSTRRERLSVKIPAGIDDGGKIRLRGKGQPGMGGQNGDLIITTVVEPHRYFRRDGNDILLDVPVTVSEAALGAKVNVPTLDGQTKVTIPPGSSSGQKLRLKGKGVKSHRTHKTGDMFLVLKVVVPKGIDKESRRLLEEFARRNPQHDVRKEWG